MKWSPWGSHLPLGHLWVVAGPLGAHPVWSRSSLLSMGCGSQSGGSPSTARQGMKLWSCDPWRNERRGDKRQEKGEVGVHVSFPREIPAPVPVQAILYSNSMVRVAGLPEGEKVKMLGNMPTKESGAVLVRGLIYHIPRTLRHPGIWVNSSKFLSSAFKSFLESSPCLA